VTYAHGAVTALPAASDAIGALFGSVGSDCPGALADIGNSPPEQINWRAMQALVREWELDADVVAAGSRRTAFDAFAAKVGKLRWSSRGTRAAVRRTIEFERRYVEATPTPLCTDIRTWAADPSTTPVGALQFVAVSNRNIARAGLPGLVTAIVRLGKRADQSKLLTVGGIADDYNFKENDAISRRELDLFKVAGLEKPLEMLEQDASARSDGRNMVSQVESCFTETQDYRQCRTPPDTRLPLGSGPGQVEVSEATKGSYTVTAHSQSGGDFAIIKSSNGTIARKCSRAGIAGCASDGTW